MVCCVTSGLNLKVTVLIGDCRFFRVRLHSTVAVLVTLVTNLGHANVTARLLSLRLTTATILSVQVLKHVSSCLYTSSRLFMSSESLTTSVKVGGYQFYRDVLGSPRYIVAPMVDQSELVCLLFS